MSPKERNPETSLQIRRLINAPRERVFKAWTDPKELVKWHAPDEKFTIPIIEIDLRVGGKYQIAMKPNKDNKDVVHVVGGVYKEVRPPEKLVYTWIWEDPKMDVGETIVTIEFIAKGNQTEVIFTHDLFPNSVARDHHNQGWTGIFNRLEKLFQ